MLGNTNSVKYRRDHNTFFNILIFMAFFSTKKTLN